MELRRYGESGTMTVFTGVAGAVFLVLAVALVVHGSVNIGSGAGPLISLVVGAVGVPFGMFFVVSALRPYALVADDKGLCLRRMFGSRFISWDAVLSLRVERGGGAGPWVEAVLRDGAAVRLPASAGSEAAARRIAGELSEALRERRVSAALPGQAPEGEAGVSGPSRQ